MIEEQRRLEAEYQREEDRLLDEFHNERKQEALRLSAELQQEWEIKLKELTEKFDKEFGQKKKKMKDNEKKVNILFLLKHLFSMNIGMW